MPVTYSIDAGRKMIRTTCSGALTFAEVMEHFRSLSADPACSGPLDVLLDVSETRTLPNARQIQTVGDTLGTIRRKAQFGACAVVARSDALYGMMRMFEVLAGEHFRVIEVFRKAAEADSWLATQQAAINRQ